MSRLLGLKVDHCDYLLGGSGCYYGMNYLFLCEYMCGLDHRHVFCMLRGNTYYYAVPVIGEKI